MRGALRIRAWSATSVGMVREGNEDSYFHGSTAFAVADGMGGHVAGEVASATALDPISELDGTQFHSPQEASDALSEAITTANTTVFEKAAGDPELRGMGTTLTALLVRDGRFHLAHVGDSRAYLLRQGEPISRLTTDHTLVQQLIDEGRLSRDEADTHPQRSVITRAIGVEPHVEIEQHEPYEMLPGDQILLCSDGLTGPVKDDEIARILNLEDDGQAACQALIDAANAGGGPDNITVVLLRVESGPPGGSKANPPAGGSRSLNLGLSAGGSKSNGHSGDTAEIGSPISLSHAGGAVTRIRTRKDEDADFDAAKMGRYGEPQGGSRQPRKLRRLLVRLLAGVILLGLLAAGGYLLWSRTYFVGEYNDHVAIFHGVRQQVGGLPLNELAEETNVRIADLPPPLRNPILERGVRFSGLEGARRYVDETLRSAARKTQPERGQVENSRPSTTPTLTPEPTPIPQPNLTPTASP